MSFNQSRSDKSEVQYRKSGRSVGSNQQRNSSGGYGKGGGGGPAPSPALSSSSSSSVSLNRSYKKSNNAQGGQPRVHSPVVNSSDPTNAPAPRNVQNGAHVRPQFQGGQHEVPVTSGMAKHVEVPANQRSGRSVPKAPTSQSTTVTSDNAATALPAKGDASKAFPFQFGSIVVEGMQGMQIPARTSSAPPNLDEQRRAQARQDPALRANLPASAPKQPPRKDSGATGQSNNVGEAHPVPKVKKDVAPPAATQKPSVNAVPMSSMQMSPFHQAQVSMQFGGPSPPIQPPATSLQMPMHMPLSMGNAHQLQHQVFVQGLQAHPMPPQGMIHQGQGMGFSTPMGGQLPQLSNMGIGIGPQYPQQPVAKFNTPRKTPTVKITHPETHEELRLDKRTDAHSDAGSSGLRSHPNMPSQPQSNPSFAPPHSINYYPNSMFYPPPSSLPLSNSQMTPNAQGPRLNYPISQGPQNVSFLNAAAGHSSLPVNKTINPSHGVIEPSSLEHARDTHNMTSIASGTTQVTVKPVTGSAGEKIGDFSLTSITPKPSRSSVEVDSSQAQKDLVTSSESSSQNLKPTGETSKSLPSLVKQVGTISPVVSDESRKPDILQSASTAISEESMPALSNTVGRREEQPLSRSNSIKEHQKKTNKKGHNQHLNQDGDGKTAVASSATVDVLPKSAGESISFTDRSISVASESKSDIITEGRNSISSEVSAAGVVGISGSESCETNEREEEKFPEKHMKDNVEQNSSQCVPSKPVDISHQSGLESVSNVSNEFPTSGTAQSGLNDGDSSCVKNERGAGNMNVSTSSTLSSGTSIEISSGSKESNELTVTESGISDQRSAAIPNPDISESASKSEDEVFPASGLKEKPAIELSRVKSAPKSKKKKKEILKNADARGTTTDLYMAYKGPEEKGMVMPSVGAESGSAGLKQESLETVEMDGVEHKEAGENKAEPDDWEDAEISTSELDNIEQSCEGLVHDRDGTENGAKKYSRDFLLKFADQCIDLPEGFEITSDIAEALMSANVNASHLVDRDSYPSPGRGIDRQSGGPRMDRRGSGVLEDDKWSKGATGFTPRRDLRPVVGYGGNAGFRLGQGPNYGVLRHPQAPAPGGILQIQPIGSHGMMQRNNSDADRWQRGNYQQKGLIPSPHTPQLIMHRAERKYEVGKVTDEEQAKQRQLKAILNKLTPQNFDRLFEQVKDVNIDNAVTLIGVINQIFDKALMEPTFCEMYANFCSHLAGELPDFSEDNEKITFKRLLLNKCQEEFERGEREQEEANKVEEEGQAKQTEEEREEKRIQARRRMLGNIRLIGELYKKRMLTERIMHECIKKLLGQYPNPDEEDIEALCKLMSTIGEMIDHPKAKEHMDAYFDMMLKLSNNMKLSSRVRFMLKDAIDLRRNKWQQRRKVEGPKKIDEVHRDAAQERQNQARHGRGPGINSAARRGPVDFGSRGSPMLSSPGAQMSGYRGLSSQVRSFAGQDARFDDRQSFEARTVPLTQRPVAEDSLTLGPQGGLARGMSFRGPPAMPSTPDVSVPPGDARRTPASLNGFNPVADRVTFGSRDNPPDRFAGPAAYDQIISQERNVSHGNRDLRNTDRNLDRSVAASPATRVQAPGLVQNNPQEKTLSEERLRDMSMAAIKEFYSARDEKEVALCIKDMSSPSYHPSMIALWVSDSFERKDMERDLLAKLLVNLTKTQDATLSPVQLVKGFETVLVTLEDAVNDAPRAAEFLGLIFSKVITNEVVSLAEIGNIVHKGGEEPGSLLEFGLAGDVIGSTLEMIKKEKGEAVLNDIRASSKLHLEDFRPPGPSKSRILEKLIQGT